MNEGGFQLYKWYSNILEIEKLSMSEVEEFQENLIYVKLIVGIQLYELKILGVLWNKEEDIFFINFVKILKGVEEGLLIKRKMLFVINSIFDLFGIVVFVVIVGKVLYSKVCLRKLRWDEEVLVDIQKLWIKWLNDMRDCFYVCIFCSVVGVSLIGVFFYGFLDVSKLVVLVVVYVVIIYIVVLV